MRVVVALTFLLLSTLASGAEIEMKVYIRPESTTTLSEPAVRGGAVAVEPEAATTTTIPTARITYRAPVTTSTATTTTTTLEEPLIIGAAVAPETEVDEGEALGVWDWLTSLFKSWF